MQRLSDPESSSGLKPPPPRAYMDGSTSSTSDFDRDSLPTSSRRSSSSDSHHSTNTFKYKYDLLLTRLLRRTPKVRKRTCFLFYIQFLVALFTVLIVIQLSSNVRSRVEYTTISNITSTVVPSTRIIVITPTYKRASRLADMTRMANTLTHIKNLHWLVVEDNNGRMKMVERLLNRTQLPYTYFAARTVPGYPRRGWYQRTMALQYLRNFTSKVTDGATHSVVYFADDDNSYDVRLFDEYIRNVRTVGVWAVGLVGGALIEMPDVQNDTVVGWNVAWNKHRKFATDMAGFAVSLDVILRSDAVFGTSCKRGSGAPETCLLEDLGLNRSDLEPFGFDQDRKEVLVWHTKTVKGNYSKRVEDIHGFYVE